VKYAKLGNDMIEVIQEFCDVGNVVGSSGDVKVRWRLEYVPAGKNLVRCRKYFVGEF